MGKIEGETIFYLGAIGLAGYLVYKLAKPLADTTSGVGSSLVTATTGLGSGISEIGTSAGSTVSNLLSPSDIISALANGVSSGINQQAAYNTQLTTQRAQVQQAGFDNAYPTLVSVSTQAQETNYSLLQASKTALIKVVTNPVGATIAGVQKVGALLQGGSYDFSTNTVSPKSTSTALKTTSSNALKNTKTTSVSNSSLAQTVKTLQSGTNMSTNKSLNQVINSLKSPFLR